MEKNFLLSYQPAQLRKYPNRWTIEFYQLDPSKGHLVRINKTFNLNRIKDKRYRIARANELIELLNLDLLPKGWPFVEVEEDQDKSMPLLDALEFAYKVKIRGKSNASEQSYKHLYSNFKEWILLKGYSFDVKQFSNHHADAYCNYLKFEKQLGAYSFNNNLGFAKSLFIVLNDKEYLFNNPFDKIQMETKTPSRFHIIDREESKIVAKYIYENDKWLHRAMILVHGCFIRITELRRLRFNMFDFSKGIIRMPVGTVVLKNKKDNIRTIPKDLLKYFLQEDFINYPGNWFVFGARLMPHATDPVGKNTPTNRHRKIINHLEKKKLIADGSNYHFYSWKFTGITECLESMDVQHVSRQAGHSDINVTIGYRQAPLVSQQFKDRAFDLID